VSGSSDADFGGARELVWLRPACNICHGCGVRIAQVPPLAESVPPKLYGGTERIVSYLTEELVRQGHSVTLFASGDSRTAAELHPVINTALRFAPLR